MNTLQRRAAGSAFRPPTWYRKLLSCLDSPQPNDIANKDSASDVASRKRLNNSKGIDASAEEETRLDVLNKKPESVQWTEYGPQRYCQQGGCSEDSEDNWRLNHSSCREISLKRREYWRPDMKAV
ncbi:hypothetical protein E4U43_007420 [Claviceps pusilla]|uniref:Uncharacterized protein n=1 Tax=Claviceps pusilla TaxID=123648 RepID=A0A9P7SZ47_9HYPO|nr:hypothetical protein E4U43_007420 [Claviceps pusilla]